MPSGFGHSGKGVNMTNFRLLQQAKYNKDAMGGYRTTFEWQQEAAEQLGIGSNENKQSTTLRITSNLLQNASAAQLASDLSSVETALRDKINHTDYLRSMLQEALTEIVTEIQACVGLRGNMEDRLARVQEKAALNSNRLALRDNRPGREKTMDSVEKGLLNQQGMMSSFEAKVKRSLEHLQNELASLEQVRQRVQSDLTDKMNAINVDNAVLNISIDGGADDEAFSQKYHALMKTPHTWERSTEENIRLAKHWLSDSARLRKAIRHAIHSSREVDHQVNRELNAQMMSKLANTSNLKGDLERQLGQVRDEQAKAISMRSSLASSLEAKRGPLQQAKDRLNARKARPEREHVADQVEIALQNEINNLNAIINQLSSKLKATDGEIMQLDQTAKMLEDNIRDKATALATDQQMVLMDGRVNLTTAPPSTVFTALTEAEEPRTQTLRRIRELEGELITARREREGLEKSVMQWRGVHSP